MNVNLTFISQSEEGRMFIQQKKIHRDT